MDNTYLIAAEWMALALVASLISIRLGVSVALIEIGMGVVREANYTTLLMATGLTFGTISALFGLTNGIIDQAAYTILVTVVVLSAVVPTLIATTFFEPRTTAGIEFEEIEAAEEIDAGPFPRRYRPVEPIEESRDQPGEPAPRPTRVGDEGEPA